MFHVGHLNLLQRAAAACDELVVGVTSDELSQSRKGKTPVVPFDERAEIVANVTGVARVVAQQTMDKFAAWTDVRFHRMFVGDDWRGTDTWIRLEREFALLGVEIVFFPYTGHTSSTALRAEVFGQ